VEMRGSELHTDVKELFEIGSPIFFGTIVEKEEEDGGLLRTFFGRGFDMI